MITIIAGGREFTDYDVLLKAINEAPWTPTVVVSGRSRGADKLGERWAEENKIPLEKYPADWDRYGKSAGYIRNEEMAKNAQALIALWDYKSKGTRNMIDIARRQGLRVFVWKI